MGRGSTTKDYIIIKMVVVLLEWRWGDRSLRPSSVPDPGVIGGQLGVDCSAITGCAEIGDDPNSQRSVTILILNHRRSFIEGTRTSSHIVR